MKITKSLPTTFINEPRLKNTIPLCSIGKLKISKQELVYLDIDDHYIHKVFPLINDESAVKPDYFSGEAIGAHISVIYPEEKIILEDCQIGKDHTFNIVGLFSAIIDAKLYYALKVNAASLFSLRKNYGLLEKPWFKNYLVDMHVTVAVKFLELDSETNK